MYREHTPHPVNHPCKKCKPKPAPEPPVRMGTVTVGLVMPPMGSSVNSCCDVCCATDISYIDCESNEVHTCSYGAKCPKGSVPVDVYLAKNDPMYEPLFGCYDYHEIAAALDRYLCYHICGCQGSRSVLLAAAHFTQLHTQINPATVTAWYRQATKPTAVLSPFPDALIKSKHGQQHWNLTTYGLEYQEILKPARALAGLAWGA